MSGAGADAGGDQVLMGEDAVERHLMSADKMQKKVRLMKGRNNYVHKVFGDEIPETEKAIEDFSCSYGGATGRIFFTQNYILFCNGELLNPKKLVKSKLALYKVTGATKESGVLLPSSICVTDDEGFMHKYTGFAAIVRNKAFAVLEHLMQHQPLYAKVQAAAEKAPEKAAPAERPASAPPQARQMEDELDYLSGRWGELSQGWEEQKKAQRASAALYEKPDTALVKDAIRTVYEINNIGKNVITRMEEQATMIDNTEDHLDDTAANLRNGDVKLDSVDSIAGAVVGAMKGTVKAHHHERVRAGLDGEKYYDIPILVKHSLGALQHAVLRLGPEEFCCLDPIKDTSFVGSVMRTGFWKTLSGGDALKKEAPAGEMPLMRDYKYSYESVGAVVIRCRPQHVDIRFHDGTERFRCMTSYVQALANEIVLRCGANRVSVIFEPHARRFQYNDMNLRRMIKLKPPRISGIECDNTFVIQEFEKTTENLITNAPQEVAAALDEQDQGVDELQELMRQVNANTDHIGRESRRQVEQLQHVNALASDVNASSSKTAHKAQRLS